METLIYNVSTHLIFTWRLQLEFSGTSDKGVHKFSGNDRSRLKLDLFYLEWHSLRPSNFPWRHLDLPRDGKTGRSVTTGSVRQSLRKRVYKDPNVVGTDVVVDDWPVPRINPEDPTFLSVSRILHSYPTEVPLPQVRFPPRVYLYSSYHTMPNR